MIAERALLNEYIKPHFQTQEDQTLVDIMLQKYVHASLAASKLWGIIAGRAAAQAEITRSAAGAESFEYTTATTLQATALAQAEYYDNLYNEEVGSNTGAIISVSRPSIANGVMADEDYNNGYG